MTTDTLPATRNNGAPEAAIARRAQVHDDGPLAFMMDSERFDHMQRVATAMSASAFLPDHLVGRKVNGQFTEYDPKTIMANCFRVLNQAMRWGVDPFAVCDETFVTGGKLGYQGKLIAAIVNTRAGLVGRLKYTYTGAGPERAVTVSGTFKDSKDTCEVTLTVAQGIAASDKGKGANPMWRNDPDQKLVYSGVVKWARRYCPEVIMGVLTEDDLEAIEARRASAEKSGASALNEKLNAGFTEPVARVAQDRQIEGDSEEIPQRTDPADTGATGERENPQPVAGAASEPQPAKPDAGPVAKQEPEAFPMLMTANTLIKAMYAVAQEKGVDPDQFGEFIGKVTLAHALAKRSTREAVWAAFQADKLDPATGKII